MQLHNIPKSMPENEFIHFEGMRRIKRAGKWLCNCWLKGKKIPVKTLYLYSLLVEFRFPHTV